MLNETHMDGVNGITQCPIAPGHSFTYSFRARQYGTSWYHSHYSLQYGEGVLGPLTIYGPTSADFDEEIYPIVMSDWSQTPLFRAWYNTVTNASGIGQTYRKLDNVLLHGQGSPLNGDTTWRKKRGLKLKFTRGKRYLLRLINASVESAMIFSIDGHKLQVISSDFVPIRPYVTDHVVVGIGKFYAWLSWRHVANSQKVNVITS